MAFLRKAARKSRVTIVIKCYFSSFLLQSCHGLIWETINIFFIRNISNLTFAIFSYTFFAKNILASALDLRPFSLRFARQATDLILKLL